jgi:hypothetical protein
MIPFLTDRAEILSTAGKLKDIMSKRGREEGSTGSSLGYSSSTGCLTLIVALSGVKALMARDPKLVIEVRSYLCT